MKNSKDESEYDKGYLDGVIKRASDQVHFDARGIRRVIIEEIYVKADFTAKQRKQLLENEAPIREYYITLEQLGIILKMYED